MLHQIIDLFSQPEEPTITKFYENKSIQEAKALFDELKPETQRAFITYLTNEDGKLDNYKIFANLILMNLEF